MNLFAFIGMLLLGFLLYFTVRDKIFSTSSEENFEHPAPSEIEIRQAPIYDPRTVSPSGPNPPSQAPENDEIIVHADPVAKDPYYEGHESSQIPENLRYPERSFRAPPDNDTTNVAIEGGIASNIQQTTSDNSQHFSTDFIQNGGEFMRGVFANDTISDTSYSSF